MKQSHRDYCYSLIENLKIQNVFPQKDYTINLEDVKFFLLLVDRGIETNKSTRELASNIKEFLAKRVEAEHV